MPAASSNAANSRSLPALFEASTTFPSDAVIAFPASEAGRAAPRAMSRSHTLQPQRFFLFRHQRANAVASEIEQRVHLVARERRAFSRALDLDEPARARHHDIHIGVALRVFVVVEIEHR